MNGKCRICEEEIKEDKLILNAQGHYVCKDCNDNYCYCHDCACYHSSDEF